MRRHSWTLTLLAVLMAAPARAQSDVATATLTGTIADDTRAVLAGAAVAATSVERGITRTATTDARGLYRIPFLDPGAYTVRVSSAGFAPHVVEGIQLRVGEIAVLDLVLQIANVSAEVVVTAGDRLVEPRRTQQASTVTAAVVENLPNVRRDFTPYVLILPGVTDPEVPRVQNPGMAWPTTGFAVGGSNGHANLLTIDGGEHEYGTGTARTAVNVATIQEFQVNRNAFAAEFGFTSGSAVNIVTRSGTNILAGELYGLYRSDALAAGNVFDPPGTTPFFQTVTSGGTAGGPIVRNRAFGFAAYEGWRADRTRVKPYLESPEVFGPTSDPAARVGLRAQDAYLNQLAASGHPALQRIGGALRQTLTATNYPATMRLLAENSGTFPARDRRQYWFGRFDAQLGSADTVMLRVTRFDPVTDASFLADEPLRSPSNGYQITAPDLAILGTWSRVIGTAAITRARVQVAANDASLTPPLADSASLSIDGLGTFGRSWGVPFVVSQRRYQFEETLSVFHGSHTIKAGASYRPVDYRVRHELWFGGDWIFASGVFPLLLAVPPVDQPSLAGFNLTTADPATGQPYPVTGPALGALTGLQAFNLGLPFLYRQGFSNPEWRGWAHYLGLFAQDSWSLARGVTFDYGIRYDLAGEPSPLGRHAYVSPRLGIAWDVAGDQRTVIRGGTGLFYAPVPVQVPYFGALLNDTGRYINQIFKTPLDGPHSPPALWAAGVALGKLPHVALSEADLRGLGVQTGRGAPGRVIFEVDPQYKNPYSLQASVGVSRQIASNLALDVAYLTYRGYQLGLSQEANYRETGVVDPLLGPLYTAIDPSIIQQNVARSIGSSVYHGLTVSLSGTSRKGVQVQFNYTLGRAMDDVTDTDAALSAFMPTRLEHEWARSVFDVRHVLTAYAVFQTGGGSGGSLWRRLSRHLTIAPVVRARSGHPFTLRIGRDVNGDTHSFYDRPFLAGRNTGRGPRFFVVDLRLTREVPLTRSLRLELSAEATNLTNRTNFIAVNDLVGTDPAFLRGPFDRTGTRAASRFTPLAFSAAADGRQVQLGVRLRF